MIRKYIPPRIKNKRNNRLETVEVRCKLQPGMTTEASHIILKDFRKRINGTIHRCRTRVRPCKDKNINEFVFFNVTFDNCGKIITHPAIIVNPSISEARTTTLPVSESAISSVTLVVIICVTCILVLLIGCFFYCFLCSCFRMR